MNFIFKNSFYFSDYSFGDLYYEFLKIMKLMLL